MKKVFTLLSLFILAFSLAFAQTTQSFLHMFLDSYQPAASLNVKVLPRSDKKLAVMGYAYVDTAGPASNATSYVLFDTSGNILWTKYFYYGVANFQGFIDFCVTANDTAYAETHGQDGGNPVFYLTKFAPEGQQVIGKKLEQSFPCIKSDGTNIYLIGSRYIGSPYYDNAAYVAKINPDLSLSWGYAFYDTFATHPTTVPRFTDGIVTHDNFLVLSGFSSNNGYQFARVIKLNLGGTKVWEQNIRVDSMSGTMTKILEVNGNYYVIGGINGTDIFYMKLNSNGNTVWAKKIVAANGYISDASAISDHEFSIYMNANNKDYIFGIDTNGNVKYRSQLGHPVYNNTSGNVIKLDDNIYATGRWGLPSADILFGISDARPFLAKGNANGVFGCYNLAVNSVTIKNVPTQEENLASVQKADAVNPVKTVLSNYTEFLLHSDTMLCNDLIDVDSTYTINQTVITDIVNEPATTTFTIYPNPATSQLFIETNGTPVSEVNIYNTTGSLVSQTKQPQSKSIDISQLAKGVYIAEIKTTPKSPKGDLNTVMRRWVKM